jgi:hypothetical protein
VSCRPGFFLPVRVLSRLFRRLFLKALAAAHKAGRLTFFGEHAHLGAAQAFAAYLEPTRTTEWVVYAKRPFGGPQAVLAYLSRYTHRVAISNRRLITLDDNGVSFKWKDYRSEGRDRYKVMTLATSEFIRRFLIHVLPTGFHRIRHYGLLASGKRAESLKHARALLNAPVPQNAPRNAATVDADEPQTLAQPCPHCGGRMIIIETFQRGCSPRTHPPPQSGSTPHDGHRHTTMPQCSSFSPLLDRPRRRSPGYANHASTRSIFINQPSCVRPHQSPHPPQPRRSVRSIPSPQLRRLVGGAQIPIARAAPSRLPQRAFLPWRFSDAGRRSAWHRLRAAGIRKPSQ